MIKLMNYELYLWKLCMFYEINVYDLSHLIDESTCVYIYVNEVLTQDIIDI